MDAAKSAKIELKAYAFQSIPEQLRSPRIVRVGIFQNSIPVATWTPVKEARDAFHQMAKEVLAIAATANVNVFCFQEAWGKFFILNLECRVIRGRNETLKFWSGNNCTYVFVGNNQLKNVFGLLD